MPLFLLIFKLLFNYRSLFRPLKLHNNFYRPFFSQLTLHLEDSKAKDTQCDSIYSNGQMA